MKDDAKQNFLSDVESVISKLGDNFQAAEDFANNLWGENDNTDKNDVRNIICHQFLRNAGDLIENHPEIADNYISFVLDTEESVSVEISDIAPLFMPIARSFLKQNNPDDALKYVEILSNYKKDCGEATLQVSKLYPQIASVYYIAKNDFYSADKIIESFDTGTPEASEDKKISEKWVSIFRNIEQPYTDVEMLRCFKSMLDEIAKIKAAPVWDDRSETGNQIFSDHNYAP